MGQTNHETPKTIQATMEPSSDLRVFLATKSPAAGKIHFYSSGRIVPLRNFQRIFTNQEHQFSWHHGNTHDGTSSMYQNWNEVGRLSDHEITSSKLETFLTRQRPILQFQFF